MLSVLQVEALLFCLCGMWGHQVTSSWFLIPQRRFNLAPNTGGGPKSRIVPFVVRQPLVGQGLLIIESSRLHLDMSQPVGLLWMSDLPEAETSAGKKLNAGTNLCP